MTRNGVTPDCWLSTEYGNGIVYLIGPIATGDGLRETLLEDPGADREVILYYDEERTDYDRYDVLTGQRIGSSRPRLAISRYGTGEFLVTVRGEAGKDYALESSPDLDWSKTSIVATLIPDDNGVAEFKTSSTDSSAFFRACEVKP